MTTDEAAGSRKKKRGAGWKTGPHRPYMGVTTVAAAGSRKKKEARAGKRTITGLICSRTGPRKVSTGRKAEVQRLGRGLDTRRLHQLQPPAR